jgi:hypothetical protein
MRALEIVGSRRTSADHIIEGTQGCSMLGMYHLSTWKVAGAQVLR